ncbi:MAG: HEAT repeat domain-containing protein [Planctomycetes bacterium]|nr:HEAT repeat domain-containing protein [Planctomycetota bacterium]
MPRLVMVVTLLAALAGAQQPSREAINAWLEARRGPAGPRRLAASETMAAFSHASNVPRLLDALQRNGKEITDVEEEIDKLERKRELFAKASMKPSLDDRQTKLLNAELERVDTDVSFRRRQMHDLLRECRVLRIGYKKSLETVPADERGGVMKRLLRDAASSAIRYPARRQLLKLLAVIPNDEARAVLERVLQRDRDPYVRSAAADALGDHGSPKCESALTAGLEDKFAIVRAACMASLRVVGGKQAVGALIDRIPSETGRLRQDAILILRHLTGVTFHDNVVLWKEWWEGERGHYQRPGNGGKRVDPRIRKRDLLADGNGQGFYGLRFRSHALVYLIDVSGSMNEKVRGGGTTGVGSPDETKLTRAKRELVRSLKALPSGMMVNVVAYSDGLQPYAEGMIKLDAGNRRGLIAWAKALRADGKTNIYAALRSVFDTARGRRQRAAPEMTLDTVVLLTDGIPTAGRVQDSDLIASEGERMNDRARVVVHTVGVGPGHDAELLKRLSGESQGVYMRAR